MIMKKLLCLVLALLCIASFALADSVPSKSTADMVSVQVQGNIPADSGFVLMPVVDSITYQVAVEACQNQIEKLAASASVEAYFGEVKDGDGNVISLKEILGTDTLNVNEFMPVVVENYEESYGDVTATFQFSTPYAQGEEVLVLVGVINALTGEVEWVALAGVGTADGGIEVTFTAAILSAIQSNTAMMAVVSK